MAELTIELRRDPSSGKHDILIHLKSDEDALPHEHEQMHREMVEKIIGKGKVGKVIVQRETEKVSGDNPSQSQTSSSEPQGQTG